MTNSGIWKMRQQQRWVQNVYEYQRTTSTKHRWILLRVEQPVGTQKIVTHNVKGVIEL
jgi:hypothetical protein